jgi:hypothetical protein
MAYNFKELEEKYTKAFKDYPDVVDVPTLSKMLKVNIKYTWQHLQSGAIRSFYIADQHKYMIPKEWAIDFAVSSDYQAKKNKV